MQSNFWQFTLCDDFKPALSFFFIRFNFSAQIKFQFQIFSLLISVSAICLSMPETLQKLHESSKTLEQNQTAISQKIYEVQQRIETVEKEVSNLQID